MGSLGGEARGGGSGFVITFSVRGEGGGSAVLRRGGLLVASSSIGGGVIHPHPAQQVPKGK
jgi:hypothetical protein